MIYNPRSQSGFSLVEVLVSITILLLVIVGPMQIIARSISSTNFATEQINAWFLAQEGLELAQKGRDDLVLQNFKFQINPPGEDEPMNKFLADYADCFTADGCGLNIGDGITFEDPEPCGTISNCRLYLYNDPQRSSYRHDFNVNNVTPFTRVIKMEETSASGKVREILVTSTVTWRTGSLISSQRVEAVTYLFNVYDTD
jgi:prepilin-type N-terminal cleavage/methylation domain-containing protein